ncbi:MAG: hypothetical protein GC136_00075 [Alphaproteobacteria bacterium]|nr:hypothetical protein [Alphaproteobacteria bacterium]
MSQSPQAPALADLGPEETFNILVAWVEERMKTLQAPGTPGILVGISGTDSIITFLVCAKALENIGRADKMVGLNFEHTLKNEIDMAGTATCIKDTFNWVAHDILPWLQQKAPQAQIEIDSSLEQSDEDMRWALLRKRTKQGLNPRQGLAGGDYLILAGSRNDTEETLGLYSQSSKCADILPIINLSKTQVLDLCAWLGVPQIAIDKSREVDCDCGRFETQANYMRELDLYIKFKRGEITKEVLEASMDKEALIAVRSFFAEERLTNAHHGDTPYKPPADQLKRIPV